MQAAVESIVEGLFSVLVTMGVVPIIRCPKVRTTDSCHRDGLFPALPVPGSRHLCTPFAVSGHCELVPHAYLVARV